jgi:hypothetical protein
VATVRDLLKQQGGKQNLCVPTAIRISLTSISILLRPDKPFKPGVRHTALAVNGNVTQTGVRFVVSTIGYFAGIFVQDY